MNYRLCGQRQEQAALEIELVTGRKHQIRVQLAAAGAPIVGDLKYGSRVRFRQGIALHARRLAFEHPVRKTAIELEAPVPETWLFSPDIYAC